MPIDEGPITKPILVEDKAPITRRERISKEDLKMFGYTAGRLGCRMAAEGRTAQSHTEECRARILKCIEEAKKN